MKRIFLSLIYVFSLLTAACTSDEGLLKEQSINVGTVKFNEIIRQESEETLSQSPGIQQSYIEFMKAHSEVSVADVKFKGENQAVVSLVLKTYPDKLRQTLLEVAQKVAPSKSRQFNFGEALSLIAKQRGIKEETEEKNLVVLKFQKVSERWTLIEN